MYGMVNYIYIVCTVVHSENRVSYCMHSGAVDIRKNKSECTVVQGLLHSGAY